MGPPQDVVGECNAHLYLADDYGDNDCTCRCGLAAGHSGLHRESFTRRLSGKVDILWTIDERHSREQEDSEALESVAGVEAKP